jgi:hypothetical protein
MHEDARHKDACSHSHIASTKGMKQMSGKSVCPMVTVDDGQCTRRECVKSGAKRPRIPYGRHRLDGRTCNCISSLSAALHTMVSINSPATAIAA